MSDEQSRLLGLARRAMEEQIPVYSSFLDPYIRQWLVSHIHVDQMAITFFGGAGEAQRQIAIMHPDHIQVQDPIVLLEASWKQTFGSPAHRDILGAALSTGIKRDMVGDIWLEAGRAIIAVLPPMDRFLTSHLMSAGRITLNMRVLDKPWQPQEAKPTLVRDITVSSLRVDTVLAAGYNLSRSKAVELIESASVFCNWQPCTKPDHILATGDTVTVRRKGRLVIQQMGGRTKKGRIRLRIDRFE